MLFCTLSPYKTSTYTTRQQPDILGQKPKQIHHITVKDRKRKLFRTRVRTEEEPAKDYSSSCSFSLRGAGGSKHRKLSNSACSMTVSTKTSTERRMQNCVTGILIQSPSFNVHISLLIAQTATDISWYYEVTYCLILNDLFRKPSSFR